MPTGDQFREAAARMRTSADRAEDARTMLSKLRNDTGIEGGTFEAVVDQAIEAQILNASVGAQQCLDAHDEFISRAMICDEYTAAVAQHRVRHREWGADYARYMALEREGSELARWPGSEPRKPAPPFSWVEAG